MQPWDSSMDAGDPVAPAQEPVAVDPPSAEDDHGDDGDEALVRPFVITGGRARHASIHLRVETLVVSTQIAGHEQVQFEHAAILYVCQRPISVAEAAALVGVPLGVAQILVGDLAQAELVRVHEASSDATPTFLLRMIDAVRAL